jgi:hypothetical protein
MLHVTFGELPGGGKDEVIAQDIGPCHRERQNILELIAKSVRPSRLVKRRT